MSSSRYKQGIYDMQYSSRSPELQNCRSRKRSHNSNHSRQSSPIDVPKRFARPPKRFSRSPKKRKTDNGRCRSRESYQSPSQHKYDGRSGSLEKRKESKRTEDDWWMMETAKFLQKLAGKDVRSPQKSRLAPSSPEVITLDDDDDDCPPKAVQEDDTVVQRKLLGLMYTVEQEMQKTGGIEQRRIKEIYNELGLHITEAESERIMKTIMENFSSKNQATNINLAAYGIKVQPMYDPSIPPPPYFDPTRPPPPFPPAEQNRQDPELQKILTGISALAKIDGKSDVDPVIKPLANQFIRVEDIYKDEEISFAYDPEKFMENNPRGNNYDELKEMMKKISDLKPKPRAVSENLQDELEDNKKTTHHGIAMKLELRKFGVPHGFSQPVIQNLQLAPPVITIEEEKTVASLLRGQRIALPRTILPDSIKHGGSNYNFQCTQQPFHHLLSDAYFEMQQHETMSSCVPTNTEENNMPTHIRTDTQPPPPGMLKSPHQLLYKNESRSPANLRDSLRKKFLDRMRENRLDRQNAKRSLTFGPEIRKILIETVETEMKDESSDEKAAMISVLQAELQREYDEYEKQLDLEEQALLDHLEPDAFCPSCKRSAMEVSDVGCLCKDRNCNFGFVFKNGVTPSQAELGQLLLTTFEAHGETECSGALDPVDTADGLFLKCNTCNRIEQIL